MKLIWNRTAILLLFATVVVLLGVFVYGQAYFLHPIKERYELTAEQVATQKKLKADYPSEATLLDDYRQGYEETWGFLPEGETFDQELIVLERLAAEENVAVQQVARVDEPQPIEGFDENYRKSTYEIEVTSTTVENLQRLVEKMESLERIWNIYSFGTQKLGDASFAGTFTVELFYYIETSEGE